jgi:hypothetical protein
VYLSPIPPKLGGSKKRAIHGPRAGKYGHTARAKGTRGGTMCEETKSPLTFAIVFWLWWDYPKRAANVTDMARGEEQSGVGR